MLPVRVLCPRGGNAAFGLVEAIGHPAVRAVRWRPDAVIRPRALLRPQEARHTGEGWPMSAHPPIAGYRAQGRLGQLSAIALNRSRDSWLHRA